MEQRGLKEYGDKFFQHYEIISNKNERLNLCNKWWLIDRFDVAKVKNFKKTNLCKDKFCANCKKVKQAQRMKKYIPELEKYCENLYHMVLTIPNVNGLILGETIKKMAESFRKLIYYLRGDRVVKGYEYISNMGYRGAIRSLEVTYQGDNYHPHYHIAIIFDNLNLEKNNINTYSYSYGKLKNYYSKEEILIQKIWYLIWNGKRITKKNIDNLDIGYSCKLDKFKNDDFNELFKYMVKEMDETNNNMSYDNFKVLYESLYRVKQIQGYGELYQIDDNIDEELFEDMYNDFINDLYEKEIPLETLESPKELLEDDEYVLISKKTYIKYINEIEDY